LQCSIFAIVAILKELSFDIPASAKGHRMVVVVVEVVVVAAVVARKFAAAAEAKVPLASFPYYVSFQKVLQRSVSRFER